MNDNIKKALEILGVEPGENFKVKLVKTGYILPAIYRIGGETLRCSYEADGSTLIDLEMLYNLLNGKAQVIKIPRPTGLEQRAMDLYKDLGYTYIAKDMDGGVYFYEDKPLKSNRDECWDNVGCKYFRMESRLKFDWLRWEDTEPYYIGD